MIEFDNGERKDLSEFKNYEEIVNYIDSIVCERSLSLLLIKESTSKIKIDLLNNCISKNFYSRGCGNPMLVSLEENNLASDLYAKLPKRVKKEKIAEYIFNPSNREDLAESPKKACFRIYLPSTTSSSELSDLIVELISIYREIMVGTPINHTIPIKLSNRGRPPSNLKE